MKRIFFVAVASLVAVIINGQAVVGGSSNGGTYTGTAISVQAFFRDGITPKFHTDILGTPFLFDNFLLARVQLADKRVFDSVYVKLNVYDNKVHFLNEYKEELQIGTAVDEVVITDKSNPSWQGNIYRSGYTGGGSDFYQVVADGQKIQLLKKVRLNIWESRALGEQNKRSFEYEDQLYFAADNTVYVETKKCGSVIAGLIEKYQEKVKQYVAEKDLRCNKEEDMKKLVEYYNSL